MTFNVMISMADCVVLCADRSTFSVYEDGRSELAEQSVRKITETPHGFITASGWADLIQPVKARFAMEAPKAVGDMLSIIQEEQEKFAARKPELAQQWIPLSTWKLSIPMSQGVVAAFYDSAARALSGLRPGLAMLTFPSETSGHDRSHVEEMFRDGRFVTPTYEAVDGAISQVLRAVSYLRKRGIPVSREIDVAVHRGCDRVLLERATSG